jgi:hypothetical protein
MKMRIQGNVIRFRLNRREVTDIEGGGAVECGLEFPGGRRLTYAVEPTRAGAVAATFDGESIRVGIPDTVAREWASGDQVGIHENAHGLEIVVEKDFQCMHKGDAAKDPDAYPNPMAD